MGATTVSPAGVKFTAGFEGCRLTAYPDPGTNAEPFTLGYGHTGPDIHEGMTCTQEQADAWLQSDLNAAARAVLLNVKVPLTQNQLDALSDFVFNVGAWNFAKSSLLRFLNAGYTTDAANQFQRWSLADGKVMLGLVKRRKAEAALFLTPDAPCT